MIFFIHSRKQKSFHASLDLYCSYSLFTRKNKSFPVSFYLSWYSFQFLWTLFFSCYFYTIPSFTTLPTSSFTCKLGTTSFLKAPKLLIHFLKYFLFLTICFQIIQRTSVPIFCTYELDTWFLFSFGSLKNRFNMFTFSLSTFLSFAYWNYFEFLWQRACSLFKYFASFPRQSLQK